jgi:hypothetical protein
MTPSFLALVTGVGLIALAPAHKGGFALPLPALAPPAPAQESGAPPPAAPAPATIPSEVMVLHATNDSSGIDPKLGKIPALSRPPFSSYNSYKLLTHTAQPLARGLSSLFNLPTGRQLQLLYKDVIPPHKQGLHTRYLVSASIQSPTGKSFLPLVEVKANPGEWFWVGGQEYHGGALFIGIKIR